MFIRTRSEDRYINPLTDFGFKRLFGSEPNKALLIDFLNVILPSEHTVSDLSFRNSENLGNTELDRKAIFDIYCQSRNGEHFIVEIQKAKQNFFKDRSIYYSTFPIQEQAQKSKVWDYKLSAVYTLGVLDFIFDDHKNDDTIVHVVELKDQDCKVFYDKLKFIYIELPKFTKTIDQLDSHFDKWLYLLRHLPDLDKPPKILREKTFEQLFKTAEIAKFSAVEQNAYADSLKYYWDLNNVVDTSRQEGREEGREEERLRSLKKQRSLLLRQLSRKFGNLPDEAQKKVNQLSVSSLEELSEAIFDLQTIEDLEQWLSETGFF